MADVAVSFLLSDVLWKLTSSSIETYRLLHGIEDDVAALRLTLEQIQAVLEDAEVKQRKQKAVEIWLKRLRSASLELENVLDEVPNEAMQQWLRLRLLIQRGIIYRVRAFFSSNYHQLRFRIRIVQKVKDVRRRLDAIAANRSNFNLSHATISVDDARVGGDRKGTETSSLVRLSETYGRNTEMEMITQKICNKYIVRHYANDVRVYAIWGMGGVGKTTLARLVYNHETVATHFELKCWVHVSEFEIEKLTKGIIESIDGCRCKLSQLDKMQVHLQNKLHKKRFLIVLDDVWNDDIRKWEEISKPLSCGAEGSIVMVTTRSQEISRTMARVPEFIHRVGCLSEEDSWSLFKKLAFGVGREGEDIKELEPIGMEIVEKCKGLPLALKALGSLMWSKTSVVGWQRVKESNLWELQGDKVDILPALELSYDNLLPYMKRCFAYCCLFPNGYEMAKDLLIQLWMTNGFIPSCGKADLYTLGEEIFNCLRQRSFFEDVENNETSIGCVCKMHDMMHELARYVMRNDCSVITIGKEGIGLIFEHKYLRVLHLIGIGGPTLPESIGKLKNLRYLNLSGSNINVLPESIIYLQNLQVLILHSCIELWKLPDGMRYLRNLQWLDITNCYKLQCMPGGIGKLESLKRLSNFTVGKQFGARIGELENLNLLERALEIQGLENVKGLEDARRANLGRKTNLKSLDFVWGNRRERFAFRLPSDGVESVLEGLEPNSNLRNLKIRGYQFIDFERCYLLSAIGKLPNLKDLFISNLYLVRLHEDNNTTSGDGILFPSLETLHIASCMNFVSLPSNLPRLKRLTIRYCPALRSLPDGLQSLGKLDYLEISGCEDLVRRCEKETGEDWPKISHVPDIHLS
ncbi:hypothetical protein OSB04_013923 [Centaurea solstitialis]|uniref:Disease resistance protein n=1 Tax=Centaurea solstitialis TaxID=347529 RepID=A0AA38WQW7_9ASTR|nr:hypothetical protein OSB04_013923 [Centaurea solstitialis]